MALVLQTAQQQLVQPDMEIVPWYGTHSLCYASCKLTRGLSSSLFISASPLLCHTAVHQHNTVWMNHWQALALMSHSNGRPMCCSGMSLDTPMFAQSISHLVHNTLSASKTT